MQMTVLLKNDKNYKLIEKQINNNELNSYKN